MKSRNGALAFLVIVMATCIGIPCLVFAADSAIPLGEPHVPHTASHSARQLAQATASSTDNAVFSPPQFTELPDGLLRPSITFPKSTFRRTIRRDRSHVCDALQKEGWVSNAWQNGSGKEQQWSCGAEKALTDLSDPGNPPGSLFVGARGKGSNTVSSVRLKINFLSGEITPFVLEQAVATTEQLLAILGWGHDPELVQKVREQNAFKIVGNGYRISLNRERSDVPRYNFQIISEAPGIYQGVGVLARDRELLAAPYLGPIE